MKKHIWLYLLFLPFLSCGSDNSNPLVSQDQLLGRWIQESSNGVILNTNDRYLTLTFSQDGTFEMVIISGRLSGNPITDTLSGTFFISGSQLTTLFSNGTSDSVSVKFEDTRMIFEDSLGNTTTYLR
ncbi:MAG: hypothetical protein ACO36I_10095 [Candidatus Latescibacterota bacterium]|jgi:hypothetical protein